MKVKKKILKFPLIMCIITFLIGIFLSSASIGIPIKEMLITWLISFFPFFTFLLITILAYRFQEKYKKMLIKITGFLSFLLIIYYFIALFVCLLLAATNPITDPKYYKYYVSGEVLGNVFPSKIPDNAENIRFYYAPGFLQAGTIHSLYYVDKDMTKEKFDAKYKDKAKWIGHKEEYKDEDDLLSAVFGFTPAYQGNENDYIIYLVEGSCDDSGYCNHGEFLMAAFNEETKEVVFKAEQW